MEVLSNLTSHFLKDVTHRLMHTYSIGFHHVMYLLDTYHLSLLVICHSWFTGASYESICSLFSLSPERCSKIYVITETMCGWYLVRYIDRVPSLCYRPLIRGPPFTSWWGGGNSGKNFCHKLLPHFQGVQSLKLSPEIFLILWVFLYFAVQQLGYNFKALSCTPSYLSLQFLHLSI